MQNAEWAALFRQIPQDWHHQLSLVLVNRAEIAVEAFFRVEPAMAIIRGRMGGTTDGGMTFMVPYDQLAAICVNRTLAEQDVAEMFKNSPQVNPLPKSNQGNALKPLAANAPSATPVPVVPSFGRPPEATSVARNNLLERLRAARQAAGSSTNGSGSSSTGK